MPLSDVFSLKPSKIDVRPVFLPIFSVSVLVGGIIICLVTCKSNGTCPQAITTISSTGAQWPSLSLFSLVFTCAAWLGTIFCAILNPSTQFVCVWRSYMTSYRRRRKAMGLFICRHQYVVVYSDDLDLHIRALNIVSSIFKLAMVAGMMVVGNVQVSSPMSSLHYTGAVFAFGGAIGFMTLDLIISNKMKPEGTTMVELWLRAFCTVWLYVGVVIMAVGQVQHPEGSLWAFAEWNLLLGLSAALLTYIFDFSRLNVTINFDVKPREIEKRKWVDFLENAGNKC